MVRAAIVGAAGYVGGELVRLLLGHSEAKITYLADVQQLEGKPLSEFYPSLRDLMDQKIETLEIQAIAERSDVVYLALPHGKGMDIAPQLLKKGLKVIDIGADYRLQDAAVFEKWYQVKHTSPDLLVKAVYGLPELNRKQIKKTRLLSNPGCYPTSAILAMLPLLEKKLVDTSSIIFDSKSGVSGAGRSSLVLPLHFPEVNEDFKAYSVAAHRHTPEIEEVLSRVSGESITVNFTPHLIPITRGMLTTAYADLLDTKSTDELVRIYQKRYAKEPFVRVCPPGQLPQVKHVAGSNFCDLGLVADSRTGRVIVVSVIDNLIKGAAGQAVQNMNLMFGLDETMGLRSPALFP